jgi:hypothetical protein
LPSAMLIYKELDNWCINIMTNIQIDMDNNLNCSKELKDRIS